MQKENIAFMNYFKFEKYLVAKQRAFFAKEKRSIRGLGG
jgi:hypothetical protein